MVLEKVIWPHLNQQGPVEESVYFKAWNDFEMSRWKSATESKLMASIVDDNAIQRLQLIPALFRRTGRPIPTKESDVAIALFNSWESFKQNYATRLSKFSPVTEIDPLINPRTSLTLAKRNTLNCL